jgi:hypothetical protein
LRLGLRRAWPFHAGTGAAAAGPAMLRTALARAAITMTVTMFFPGLRQNRRDGQCQGGNGYQQATHGFSPRKLPIPDIPVTSDSGSGSLIPLPWPMVST